MKTHYKQFMALCLVVLASLLYACSVPGDAFQGMSAESYPVLLSPSDALSVNSPAESVPDETSAASETSLPEAESMEESVEESTAERPIRILLDAGHIVTRDASGTATGMNAGVAGGYCEAEMAWKLQGYLKEALEGYGFIVGTTRTTESGMLVTQNEGELLLDMWRRENVARGAMAADYDLFISLHSNALTADAGSSLRRAVIMIPADADEKVRAFGTAIGVAMRDLMGLPEESGHPGYEVYTELNDEGEEAYAVMRGADQAGCPCYLLIENSFHTNVETCLWLTDENNLRALAAAQAKQIAVFYGKER